MITNDSVIERDPLLAKILPHRGRGNPWQIRARGFTLIELLLALTIVSIIFLGMNTLTATAARLTLNISEEVRLQNELVYALRGLELNIRRYKEPELNCPQTPNAPCSLSLKDQAGNMAIQYNFNPDTSNPEVTTYELNRFTQPPAKTEIVSNGVIIQKRDQINQPLPLFDILGPTLVEVNLAAQKTLKDGRVIRVPGITKSILLRGV